MEKVDLFYKEAVNLILHCKDQDFIPESEAEYILGCLDEIKKEIDNT